MISSDGEQIGIENTQLGDTYSPPDYAAPSPLHTNAPAPTPEYAAPAHVPCPQNLLISCQPTVQHVPCSSDYTPQPHASHVYRVANEDIEESGDGRQEPLVGQSQDE